MIQTKTHGTGLTETAGLAPAQVRRELKELAKSLPDTLRAELEASMDADAAPEVREVLERVCAATTERCEITELQLR